MSIGRDGRRITLGTGTPGFTLARRCGLRCGCPRGEICVERPFDTDAMVEVVIELLITSLHGAARLDPAIDVSKAVAKLEHVTS